MTWPAPASRSPRIAAIAVAGSAIFHAGGLALATCIEPRAAAPERAVEVVFEVVTPPTPAPPPAPEPAPPPPRRMAALRPPRDLAPPPPPPPSNEPPPPATPPARPVLRVGVSLGSTTSGGAFAVGVGNTLYGKASSIAADPTEVAPYAGPSSAPTRLSAQPRLLEQPQVAYPPEARKAGVAGKVVLALAIGRDGRVAAARVLAEPGSGLGEAARQAALRFRFSPALLDGESVETEIRFTYTFVLE